MYMHMKEKIEIQDSQKRFKWGKTKANVISTN